MIKLSPIVLMLAGLVTLFLSQWLASHWLSLNLAPDIGMPVVAIIGISLPLGWSYFTANLLADRFGSFVYFNRHMMNDLFVFTIGFALLSGIIFEEFYESNGVIKVVLTVLILLGLFAHLSVYWISSRALVSVENSGRVDQGRVFVVFFLYFFYMFGLYFIQKRIRKIAVR